MIKYLIGFLKFFLRSNVSKFSLVTYTSTISKKAKVYRNSQIYDSKIDDYSYIGVKTCLVKVVMGKFCSVAGDCNIGLGGHTINKISTSPIFTERNNGTGFKWVNESTGAALTKAIIIGNDVWIGSRVIVMSGVRIGDGAIIGAGSIVTKDVPPYSIVAGVPAKVIRYRFENDVILKLLSIEWWNLSEAVIKDNIHLFQSDDVTISLLEKLNK